MDEFFIENIAPIIAPIAVIFFLIIIGGLFTSIKGKDETNFGKLFIYGLVIFIVIVAIILVYDALDSGIRSDGSPRGMP
jgi:hypothetical protein